MNNPENWKASKPQKEQITQLWEKLNWQLEDYGGGITWENMLWHQANAIINGAEWCLDNKTQWIKNIK